ncbi:TPA: hypothetical protein EYP44_01065 [Candidatus Bathyarchaeota archaeon]|nr:hypothetical protein [Candidatus Bathyarchaeota archaeon]
MNEAPIQTARDRAVETLKGFGGNGRDDSALRLKRASIRFGGGCYGFSRTTDVLTPYWLTPSLNGERGQLANGFRRETEAEDRGSP